MRRLYATWIGLLAACASDPVPVDVASPAGEPLRIGLRADGFVDFDGRRVTVEEAVYELRIRCRGAGAEPPWLRVVAPADAPAEVTAVAERLSNAAYEAGVHHLEFAVEER